MVYHWLRTQNVHNRILGRNHAGSGDLMVGIKGRSGPPANQNAFRHGLAGIQHRRGEGALAPDEQAIKDEILAGLIADKGG